MSQKGGAVSLRKNDKYVEIIRDIRRRDVNKTCMDCTDKGPQCVITDFAIFVCMQCSGLHRELGHKVKTISASEFTEAEVEAIKNGGNDVARRVWLAKWTPQDYAQPDPSQPPRVREFMRLKYMEKRWYRDPNEKPPVKKKKSISKPAAEETAPAEAKAAKKSSKPKKRESSQSPPPIRNLKEVLPHVDKLVVREVAAANGDEANGENGGEAGEESAEEPDSDEERKKAAAKKKKKAAAAAAEKVGGKGKAAAKSSAAPTTAPTPAAATAAAAPPTQQQTGSILDLNVLFSTSNAVSPSSQATAQMASFSLQSTAASHPPSNGDDWANFGSAPAAAAAQQVSWRAMPTPGQFGMFGAQPSPGKAAPDFVVTSNASSAAQPTLNGTPAPTTASASSTSPAVTEKRGGGDPVDPFADLLGGDDHSAAASSHAAPNATSAAASAARRNSGSSHNPFAAFEENHAPAPTLNAPAPQPTPLPTVAATPSVMAATPAMSMTYGVMPNAAATAAPNPYQHAAYLQQLAATNPQMYAAMALQQQQQAAAAAAAAGMPQQMAAHPMAAAQQQAQALAQYQFMQYQMYQQQLLQQQMMAQQQQQQAGGFPATTSAARSPATTPATTAAPQKNANPFADLF